ncbi:MAG: HIT domain-containing protein [Mycoplasmataceae bacterium]|jgi:histidine triad (HIT) family protein|nr:HIT domain-containing protein [Mycoplasmataceae bacterium]
MDCIFCEIIKKNIKAKIIAENKHAIAFLDVNPITNGHTLVVPKKHFGNFSTCDTKILMAVSSLAKEVANKIKNSSLKPIGFNYLSNEGKIAGQEVMHFHLHVIPKYSKGNGFILNYGKTKTKNTEEIYKILTKK